VLENSITASIGDLLKKGYLPKKQLQEEIRKRVFGSNEERELLSHVVTIASFTQQDYRVLPGHKALFSFQGENYFLKESFTDGGYRPPCDGRDGFMEECFWWGLND